MKKFSVLFVFLLFLAGCGSSVTTTQQTPSQSTQQATPTPAGIDGNMAIGQTEQLDGWSVTLLSVKEDANYQIVGNDTTQVDAQHHYIFYDSGNNLQHGTIIVCHMRITNVSAQDDQPESFGLLSLPFVSGNTGQGFVVPYDETKSIAKSVPVGSSVEGDYAAIGGDGEFLLAYNYGATDGQELRWQFGLGSGGWLSIGQSTKLSGWQVTVLSARLDSNYQVTDDAGSVDAQHHYIDNGTPATLLVVHVRVTNISSSNDAIAQVGDNTNFNFTPLPVSDNGPGGAGPFTPYLQQNRLQAHVPIGSSTEGDVVTPGRSGEYLFQFILQPGVYVDWDFTV